MARPGALCVPINFWLQNHSTKATAVATTRSRTDPLQAGRAERTAFPLMAVSVIALPSQRRCRCNFLQFPEIDLARAKVGQRWHPHELIRTRFPQSRQIGLAQLSKAFLQLLLRQSMN